MPTVAVPNVLSDPGFLFYAPLGTAVPSFAVTANKFSDTGFTGAWLPIGATAEGTSFSYQTSFDGIEVAEYLLAIKQVTTGAEGSVTFAAADFTASKLKLALNGGALTVTGSTTTTMTKYTPPTPGLEVRSMLGWESLDGTVRYVVYQAVNTGTVEIAPKKGTDIATLGFEMAMEIPSNGAPFEFWTAGTARG